MLQMKISVTKADWDLAREQVLGWGTTTAGYKCNCVVAQAVKRTYPDGCVRDVDFRGFTYEDVIFAPLKSHSYLLNCLIHWFDSGVQWPYAYGRKVDLVFEPKEAE